MMAVLIIGLGAVAYFVLRAPGATGSNDDVRELERAIGERADREQPYATFHGRTLGYDDVGHQTARPKR